MMKLITNSLHGVPYDDDGLQPHWFSRIGQSENSYAIYFGAKTDAIL
jgi:hypothetical protein